MFVSFADALQMHVSIGMWCVMSYSLTKHQVVYDS